MPKPTKPKLGQNFLVDDEARHRIVDSLGDIRERTVIEIGPGHGAITKILAERCRTLIALELDPSLAAELTFHFRERSNVTIVEADVLSTPLSRFAAAPSTVDVVGNLPYYITSDILLHLFRAAEQGILRRAVLMMQREVAERIAALPGRREYGVLSATTRMYASVRLLFTLPPNAFQPPPEVYSSVVRLEFSPRFDELHVDRDGFTSFLRQTFAQKRKTLRKNLRAAGDSLGDIERAWPSGLDPQVRAEDIDVETMATLYRHLRHPPGG